MTALLCITAGFAAFCMGKCFSDKSYAQVFDEMTRANIKERVKLISRYGALLDEANGIIRDCVCAACVRDGRCVREGETE